MHAIFLDSITVLKRSVTGLFLGSTDYTWALSPSKEYLVPPLTTSKMFPLKVLDPNDSCILYWTIIFKCLLSNFDKGQFQLSVY